jgi:hypothetical protein
MTDAQWLKKHTKSVLHDISYTVTGHRFGEREQVPIVFHVKAIELDYGPCIDWSVSASVPCEKGMWGDHPLAHVRALNEKDTSSVSTCGEILEDTPAVRAMLVELCQSEERKMYSTTDTTHRARLIAALEMFWS